MQPKTIPCDGHEYATVNLTIIIDTASEFYRLAERYAQRYNTTVEIALRIGLEIGIIPHGEEFLHAMLNDPNP